MKLRQARKIQFGTRSDEKHARHGLLAIFRDENPRPQFGKDGRKQSTRWEARRVVRTRQNRKEAN